MQLNAAEIRRLFCLLNEELQGDAVHGELYLVGGAVMCLVLEARPATRDVDAWFHPSKELRAAAARVAARARVPEDWLNDGVKGFLSAKGDFDDYLELSNLRIYTASPEYLLALKCVAMRIGEEFQDIDDVRYLLRYLNITSFQRAAEIVTRYFPTPQIPQKTWYALEEWLA